MRGIFLWLALLVCACTAPFVLPSPSASTTCPPKTPVTTTHDASGVITAGGDIGLLEVRSSGFADEKVIVLVRRGARLGDQLAIRATGLTSNARGEVYWSAGAKPRSNAWGDVVFEANTKPIGNIGCWRIERDDGPRGGIIVDLGR